VTVAVGGADDLNGVLIVLVLARVPVVEVALSYSG